MLRVYIRRSGGPLITALTIRRLSRTADAAGTAATATDRTKKVEGTDNVYIFRNGNHQSMFIVTHDGVIATDPIGYGRRPAGSNMSTRSRRSPTSRSNI